MDDTISRQAAIDALWKAMFEYEDKTEKQFQESEDLDVRDWIGHRIFVQNMNDIDRQTILNLPSAQPDYDLSDYSDRLWKAAYERGKAEAEPRWIPVESEPPKERRSYWVCTDTGYQGECRWTNNIYGLRESDKWGWSIFDIPQYTKIVAYMPLPTAYERSEDE